MLLCACMCQVVTCGNQNTSNNSTGCLPRGTQLYIVVRFWDWSLCTQCHLPLFQVHTFGHHQVGNSFPYLLFTLIFLFSLVDVFAHYQLNFARFRRSYLGLITSMCTVWGLCAGWPMQIGKTKQRPPFGV